MSAGECTVGKSEWEEDLFQEREGIDERGGPASGGRKGIEFLKMDDGRWDNTYGLKLCCRLCSSTDGQKRG